MTVRNICRVPDIKGAGSERVGAYKSIKKAEHPPWIFPAPFSISTIGRRRSEHVQESRQQDIGFKVDQLLVEHTCFDRKLANNSSLLLLRFLRLLLN